MLKLNGGGICDHQVGAGKTLIMCAAAYEMKRLGLANKPMILALKANVQEIAQLTRMPSCSIRARTISRPTSDNGFSTTSRTTTGTALSSRTTNSG